MTFRFSEIVLTQESILLVMLLKNSKIPRKAVIEKIVLEAIA